MSDSDSDQSSDFSINFENTTGNSSQNSNTSATTENSHHSNLLSSFLEDNSEMSSEISQDSNDTEPYDVDEMLQIQNNRQSRANNDESVILISDTQQVPVNIEINENDDDEDDVVIIQENVETIDLCTQPLLPIRLNIPSDQVIEINDSIIATPPLTQRMRTRNPNQIHSRAIETFRSNLRTNMQNQYERQEHVAASTLNNSTIVNNAKRYLSTLDDSLDSSQSLPSQRVKINCPICFESVIDRDPQSTSCGHIFCKACLVSALRNAKKCPMCRKTLGNKGYHNIHLC